MEFLSEPQNTLFGITFYGCTCDSCYTCLSCYACLYSNTNSVEIK